MPHAAANRIRRTRGGLVQHPDHVAGDHGLHIGCAPAPQVIPFDPRVELGIIGLGTDHVEVARQRDNGRWSSSERRQYGRVAATVVKVHIEAAPREDVRDEAGAGKHLVDTFVGAVRDRRNPDQICCEPDDPGRPIGGVLDFQLGGTASDGDRHLGPLGRHFAQTFHQRSELRPFAPEPGW